MPAHALITGVLHKDPAPRTSKSGRAFATATVRVRDGDAVAWWQVVAFAETAVADLLRLSAGETLSAQGQLRAELWTPENGDAPRVNLSIVADIVTPLRQARKPRDRREAERADKPARDGYPDEWPGDHVPF